MIRYALILTILGLIPALTFISCEDPPPNLTELYNISIFETEYLTDSSYDFGLTEANGAGKSVTVILTNAGDFELTITALSLSETDHYTLTAPSLPSITKAGDTAKAIVTFRPQTFGALPAVLSITVSGFTDPFILNLTGNGNHPPTLSFGITVSGAGDSDANGFYTRDGFKGSDDFRRPLYTKSGTTNYHCYLYNDDAVYLWCIHTSLDAGSGNDPLYEISGTSIVPPASGWSPPLTVTCQDITGTDGSTTQELTANYLYSDADGDAENTDGTIYQWYRAEDEEGPFERIDIGQAKTYKPENDAGYYLKVDIIPVAADGIPTGVAVRSSSTIQITE